ncbi:MAG TPA: hypothetical protein VK468_05850 [Pyrinomonadaceae bacterium]|nr:hypothetical protein [Pyrinomonadaceae bacterium]
MGLKMAVAAAFVTATSIFSPAQSSQPIAAPSYSAGPILNTETLDTMAANVARISRSVDAMNKNWGSFFSTFSSNQGLRLSEKQQKLLMGLEVLNRMEQSLATNQKQKLDYIERLSKFRLQLSTVTDDLLPQSLDRYVALRGTTDAEELRDIRRQALSKERQELSTVVSQLQRDLDRLSDDIRRSESQLATLRARIFGEVERELADL